MATPPISFSFCIFFLLSSVFYVCLCSLENRGLAYGAETEHSHLLQLSSLLHSTVCSPSTTKGYSGDSKRASLEIVHKHGPCSQLKQPQAKAPTHAQILVQDQSRVDSIQSKFAKNLNRDVLKANKAARIPAKSGSSVGSGNFIVTVGLGTPKKYLSLIFDTGSDLTWTQCQPCARSCYNQKEPVFDPSASKSYTNITCTSPLCTQLTSATGNSPGCSSTTCVYGIQYGDNSFSVGFYGKETLTLTSSDVLYNFLFGCGQNNKGLFGGAAGLLGLGRNQISIVLQTAQKYGKVFSYCLPSSSSSTGHLTFGAVSSNSIKYTPLSSISQGTSFYGLDITGISVGGQKLSIPATVFSNSGTIIDSGTVITRLPPTAYSALRTAFRQGMSKYPMAQALSILDTCYDLSGYKTVTVPKISFVFAGGVTVDLDLTGSLYASSVSQVCLAFAGNSDDTDVGIFGNVQQQKLEVVYDLAGGRVGFGPGTCA